MSLIYDLVVPFGALAAAPAWMLRSIRHPEYREHLRERWGRLPGALRERLAALPVRPLWMQAVSVGEVLLARRLAGELDAAARFQGEALPMVLSSTTPAGRALAAGAPLPFEGVFHMPLDWAPFVSRALETVRPRALLCLETEIWPALLSRCARRGVPVLIANGRLSERSVRRYRLAAPFFREAIASIRQVCARSQADAARFEAIGVPAARVSVTGNMKFDLPVEEAPSSGLRDALKLPPGDAAFVLVAGSTSPGEEEAVLDAVAGCGVERLVLVLAPRHRERFPEVAALLERRGIRFARRSAGAEAGARVVLLDTLGELAQAYGLADAAFVGGSLVPRGGQNLIEPAARGVPVLFGPHTRNFASEASALLECGAGERVADAAALGAALARLAADPAGRRKAGEAGRDLVRRHRGATRGAVERLLPLLMRPDAAHA